MTFFNDISNTYDDWYKTKIGSFIDSVETDLAFSLFKPKQGMKILDVGCGTGNFSVKLARLGCKITGIDISEGMLAIARKKFEDLGLKGDFYNMDLLNLNFPDNYFDSVFSMAAFEFVEDHHKAFGEIFRVVKPGGQILIGTINGDSPWGKQYKEQAKNLDSIFRFAHFKTLEDLKAMSSKYIVDFGQCLFIPPGLDEDKYNYSEEKMLSSVNKGGFIAALWKKPI